MRLVINHFYKVLQRTLIAAEKQYYHELLTRNKDNMKKSWGIIKDIINKNKDPVRQTKFKLSNGSTTTDKMSISEHFNDFFIKFGPNLAKLIPHVKKVPMAYMGDAVQDTIFLDPVTFDEISTIVSNLKNNATGFDEISAVYLKMSVKYCKSSGVYL